MRRRRWVIIGIGAALTAGLVVVALVAGLQGLEVMSWLASVAGVLVAVSALLLAQPPGERPGDRSVDVHGDVAGIVSTGDATTNVQLR